MTFTAAQFARLNNYAHKQNINNCRTYDSATTVSQIEAVGDRMMATIVSEDVNKGIFSTHSVITIGPRGGLNFERTRRYCY